MLSVLWWVVKWNKNEKRRLSNALVFYEWISRYNFRLNVKSHHDDWKPPTDKLFLSQESIYGMSKILLIRCFLQIIDILFYNNWLTRVVWYSRLDSAWSWVWLRLRLRLRLSRGCIQHKITHGRFTPELQYKTIRTYYITMNPDKIKNGCEETCTKVIADRLRRGHPERGRVLCSVVDI